MHLLKRIVDILFESDENTDLSKKIRVENQNIHQDASENLFDRTCEMKKRMDMMERRHSHRYY